MSQEIEHFDLLGQPIQVGDYVAFTWSYARGVVIGVVTKLTKKRIKMSYNNSYVREGVITFYSCEHIARPGDCLILKNELPQHLTLAKLQRKI